MLGVGRHRKVLRNNIQGVNKNMRTGGPRAAELLELTRVLGDELEVITFSQTFRPSNLDTLRRLKPNLKLFRHVLTEAGVDADERRVEYGTMVGFHPVTNPDEIDAAILAMRHLYLFLTLWSAAFLGIELTMGPKRFDEWFQKHGIRLGTNSENPTADTGMSGNMGRRIKKVFARCREMGRDISKDTDLTFAEF
jgi:hypothetical protein